MKIFTLCLFLALSNLTIAQTKVKKIKAYKVIVFTEDKRIEGFLHSADTSNLNVLEDVKNREPDLISVKNTDINTIKIGRKGQVLRGTMIGTLAGGALGFVMGFSSSDDKPGLLSFSKEDKAAFGAIALGVLGGAAGTVIGTGKKKIKVKYSRTNYFNNLNVIRHYSMIKIKL